jgi:CPA1 family monovalent cation:H+ antiporter
MPGRELLINLTLGVVLFTLMVNAWSIRPLMHALKLDRLTEDEKLELDHGLQRAGRSALSGVADYRGSGVLPDDLYADIEQSIDTTFDNARPDIARGQSRRELYLTALQIEIDQLNRLYQLGVIDQYTLAGISHNLQTDREAHSLPALHRSSLDPVSHQAEAPSIFERIEQWVLQHLRERNWAIGWLARYQRLRLLQQVQRNLAGVVMAHAVLDQLGTTPDSDQILASYRQRLEQRRAHLQALSGEFPQFFQSIESELFLRSALVAARIDIEHQHQHGQIGVKALNRIECLIQSELSRIRSNAAVKLQSDCLELIAKLPLFQGLSRPVLEILARRARAVTFLEGDIIIGQGERGDALYLIDHGRASVSVVDHQGSVKHLGSLGPGDFFGEMALFGDHVRSASVVATSALTLLRLKRQYVLDIAEQYDEVRQRIEQVKNQRSSGV